VRRTGPRNPERGVVSMTRSMKESALALADRGFNVFELCPEKKHPAFVGWQEYATTDPAKIRVMWEDCPHHNIGILCGRNREPLTVLDFDPDKATDESRALWDALPETFTVRTPSGGEHKYFRTWTASISASRLAPGIDSRGGGKGYVAGPGSYSAKHNSYYTTIKDIPLAELPTEHQRILNRRKGGLPHDGVRPDEPGGANDPNCPPTPVVRHVRPKKERAAHSVSPDEPDEDCVTDPTQLEAVREALSHISADCDREDWAEVLMSIRAQPNISYADQIALADWWSATRLAAYRKVGSDGLWGCDSVVKFMNSVTPDGGVGPGTLFYLAEKAKFEEEHGPISRADYEAQRLQIRREDSLQRYKSWQQRN
jgi:Bifunctional DNA primase/polymerase, N-terminal/Primase C terminal 2 (PriCT-2)